eukprot:TRINITY_DN5663_c0_g1_i1.p1 TRINITY_DN5663_c0_g1~~TRINITY_DN5663_c0_g1_i1.p1  ORF type:complete len:123 (+),score=18.64 TRINITY_DN5663_c0_g1_i1:118-486(+)
MSMPSLQACAGGVLGFGIFGAYYAFGVLEVSLVGESFGVCMSRGASDSQKRRMRVPILLRGLLVSGGWLASAYVYGKADSFMGGMRMGALVPSAVTAAVGSFLLAVNIIKIIPELTSGDRTC